MKVMIKFMIEYIKENPKDFIESIFTLGMIFATAYMFYFLGYVFFGPTV